MKRLEVKKCAVEKSTLQKTIERLTWGKLAVNASRAKNLVGKILKRLNFVDWHHRSTNCRLFSAIVWPLGLKVERFEHWSTTVAEVREYPAQNP